MELRRREKRKREGEAISGRGTKALSVNSQFEDLTVPLDCLGTTGMGGGINFRYYRAAGQRSSSGAADKIFHPPV